MIKRQIKEDIKQLFIRETQEIIIKEELFLIIFNKTIDTLREIVVLRGSILY
jgi:hypothetical protein